MNIFIYFSNDSTKIIKLRIATENKNRRLQMFFKTGVLKIFTRKHLRWSAFLKHRCFPVKIAKFFTSDGCF